MDFLAAFTPEAREQLLNIATRQELAPGKRLMRAGEPGGDVFLIEAGGLEVYNATSSPEIILASLPAGVLVGEVSFLDDSPRSADVRADRPTRVLRWRRDDLRNLLHTEPAVAAPFYSIVARTAAARLRGIGTDLIVPVASQERHERARQDAEKCVAVIADELMAIEAQLRQDRDSVAARRRMQSLLGSLEEQLDDLFREHHQAPAADAAAEVLVQALRPWLVRSALAERCLRRPEGKVVTTSVLSHVLMNTESGDGIGRFVDRWLLDRPTLAALRQLVSSLAETAAERIPARTGRRVMLVGAGAGSLAGALQLAMRDRGGTLTVIDRRSDALAPIEGARARAPKVAVRTQTVDLAAFATGRHLPDIARQDLIVVHTVFEYLPDRLVVGFTRALAYYLAPGGCLVIGGLAPSRDGAVLRHLLGWGTVRRTAGELAALVASGGLTVEWSRQIRGPAVVLSATAQR
ncbi:MAG: CRP-like cAMP-binding protein/2-polyprenyl-3-methyl-5-hydroxy-6-metoxy-1,4-benzoquinol methylase [Myxococcota bacterium]|jgi:CRP-like cAMP-binding protein/2-polyprenyl-3-methyl-5-hydroxy-6-metoxy-1,4-benzoquinol methylase